MSKIISGIVKLRYLWYQYTGYFWTRNIISNDVLFSYYDNYNTDKEILVIFHGFSSKKEACLPLGAELTNKYRIIIPDLLGHGSTKSLQKDCIEINYNIETQLEYLQRCIINILGPDKKIHIIGYSMGGLLAGCFSAKYSNMVKSTSLLCPAGISMPRQSPVYSHYIQTNDNLLSTKSVEEAKELLYLLQCSYRYLPECVFEYYANEYNKKAEVYDKVFDELIIADYPVLEKQLKYIQSNVLVIYGENDRVIDKTCIIPILSELNSQSNIYIISNAGHVIHNTHFQECANYINFHIENNY